MLDKGFDAAGHGQLGLIGLESRNHLARSSKNIRKTFDWHFKLLFGGWLTGAAPLIFGIIPKNGQVFPLESGGTCPQLGASSPQPGGIGTQLGASGSHLGARRIDFGAVGTQLGDRRTDFGASGTQPGVAAPDFGANLPRQNDQAECPQDFGVLHPHAGASELRSLF